MDENEDSGDNWAMTPVWRRGRKATLPLPLLHGWLLIWSLVGRVVFIWQSDFNTVLLNIHLFGYMITQETNREVLLEW